MRPPLKTGERRLLVSPRAADRLEAARLALASASGALVVAPTQGAADELVRSVACARGALFAVERLMFNRLIGLLAATQAAQQGLAFVTALGSQALAARALFRLRGDPRLKYFGEVMELPGFAPAVAAVHDALSQNRVEPASLRSLDGAGEALATVCEQFEQELSAARLLDRSAMIDLAIAALGEAPGQRFRGLRLILLDLDLESLRERDLVAVLAANAAAVLATAPAGDQRSERLLAQALNLEAGAIERLAVTPPSTSLARLQQRLFAADSTTEAVLDDSVIMRSAAGEMQECVEIARQIHREAARGIPFDRIAVLLHAPDRYVPYLKEALARASIPAWFARGASLPEPGGRALLALLNCAGERLSARRFAEYLSLAQLPEPGENTSSGSAAFVPAEAEFLPLGVEPTAATDDESSRGPDETIVHAPWRWEQLLVEAAVVGGRERWHKRLDGLYRELKLRRGGLEDADNNRLVALDREIADLAHLRQTALPIIDALAELPRRASWGEWLEHLRALTKLAIRERDEVLRTLAELGPMAPIGPITLDEVRIVLSERLGRLPTHPGPRRYGMVFVAPTTYARGFDFDVVMVPGLAERLFPKKLTEDPLLPDTMRRPLSDALPLKSARVEAERLALRIAAGCARQRVFFSYPRVDADQARPRVPSFYALEIMRAAEGRLPGFVELATRAAGERASRLGWPVPQQPQQAIDEVEFDLSVLEQQLEGDPAVTIGAAHYLLDADSNPFLGRALRARARRWLRRWTVNDGLAEPDDEQRAALARHQLAARSYSPTGLQNYAACPYRFFLQAILRLAPRQEIAPIEVIDPLTRGALFHEVQFETLSALRAQRLLPVNEVNLEHAQAVLEQKLAEVAAARYEELAPAIDRVWLDGIESIRADLREWMRRMATGAAGYYPERFELAFGLTNRAQADPASIAEPVELPAGLCLRGSIDLIERGPDARLRVTDHKTGRVRAEKNLVIGGGKTLQPVLYALVAEHVLAEQVSAGRLYYCTAAGGYEERVVACDQTARDFAGEFARIVGHALHEGFLPAAPAERECEFCDYRRLCGPYEETRLQRKLASRNAAARLAQLTKLRAMR